MPYDEQEEEEDRKKYKSHFKIINNFLFTTNEEHPITVEIVFVLDLKMSFAGARVMGLIRTYYSHP